MPLQRTKKRQLRLQKNKNDDDTSDEDDNEQASISNKRSRYLEHADSHGPVTRDKQQCSPSDQRRVETLTKKNAKQKHKPYPPREKSESSESVSAKHKKPRNFNTRDWIVTEKSPGKEEIYKKLRTGNRQRDSLSFSEDVKHTALTQANTKSVSKALKRRDAESLSKPAEQSTISEKEKQFNSAQPSTSTASDEIQAGNREMENTLKETLQQTAKILNESNKVPLEFLSSVLGLNVDEDSKHQPKNTVPSSTSTYDSRALSQQLAFRIAELVRVMAGHTASSTSGESSARNLTDSDYTQETKTSKTAGSATTVRRSTSRTSDQAGYSNINSDSINPDPISTSKRPIAPKVRNLTRHELEVAQRAIKAVSQPIVETITTSTRSGMPASPIARTNDSYITTIRAGMQNEDRLKTEDTKSFEADQQLHVITPRDHDYSVFCSQEEDTGTSSTGHQGRNLNTGGETGTQEGLSVADLFRQDSDGDT